MPKWLFCFTTWANQLLGSGSGVRKVPSCLASFVEVGLRLCVVQEWSGPLYWLATGLLSVCGALCHGVSTAVSSKWKKEVNSSLDLALWFL